MTAPAFRSVGGSRCCERSGADERRYPGDRAHMGDEVAWAMAPACTSAARAEQSAAPPDPRREGDKTMSPKEYAAQKRSESRPAPEALDAECRGRWICPGRRASGGATRSSSPSATSSARRSRRSFVTHWRGSMHKDHTAAADNLPDALFYAALPAFRRALPPHWVPRHHFGENWEDLRGTSRRVYLQVTRTISSAGSARCAATPSFAGR